MTNLRRAECRRTDLAPAESRGIHFDPAAGADTVRPYLCGPDAGVDCYPVEELHRDVVNLTEPRSGTVPRSLFYLVAGTAVGWFLCAGSGPKFEWLLSSPGFFSLSISPPR